MPIPLFRAQLPLLGLKDLNKLDGIQSTGEGILPISANLFIDLLRDFP